MHILFSKASKLFVPTKLFPVKTAAACRSPTIKVDVKCDKHLAQKQRSYQAQTTRVFSTIVEITDRDKIYVHLRDIMNRNHSNFNARLIKLNVSHNANDLMWNIACNLYNREIKLVLRNGVVPEIVEQEIKYYAGAALADQNEKAKIIEDLSQGIKEVLVVLNESNDKKSSGCSPGR